MYSIYITRKDFSANPDGERISEAEFESVKQYFVHAADPDSKIPGYTVWYNERLGNIDIDRPEGKYIEEIINVARKLSAKVQGDDSELYADFTEIHSPLKPVFLKLMGANQPEEDPMIDDYNKEKRMATKMEVVDLRDPKFADSDALYTFVEKYVSNLAVAAGYTNKQMLLGIPESTVTPAQKEKLIELQKYAMDWDVRLKIVEFPPPR